MTAVAAMRPRRARSWAGRGAGLYGASVVVVAALVAPIAFLFVEASGAGTGTVAHLIWRAETRTLLWNTVRLTAVVTVLCVVVGTAAAFVLERTNLPGRRWWAVGLIVPFAIPDFVMAFGWSSLFASVHGFWGAVLVMTLGVYPLVLLPVAAALRSADPTLEETARSLGVRPLALFARVTVRQIEAAVAGGAVLVSLVVLAEYGAFEILGYNTFTTEIYAELSNAFATPVACALALVLLGVGALILATDGRWRSRGRTSRVGALSPVPARRHDLGPWRWVVVAATGALVGAALGVPLYAAIYWIFEGGVHQPGGASLWFAAWHTVLYSGGGAVIDTAAALPLAVLAVRRGSFVARFLERVSYLVLATPGIIVAFALGHFSLFYANGFAYQTSGMLIAAYAILFFPLALVGVKASVAHATPALEEAARAAGCGPLRTFARVTLPIVGPGLLASFCLVFLAGVTELTATLILIPTGAQTLATQFWSWQYNFSYGQAAPFALAMIAIAALPSYALTRFFDRRIGAAS